MHSIRLRGPWEFQPLERFVLADDGQVRSETPGLPPAGKVRTPADWGDTLGRAFLGRVRYTRGFNLPTNLDPHERVWLVADGVDHEATVSLNDRPLGNIIGSQPTRFEITALLRPHNTLIVEVSLTPTAYNDPAVRGDRAGLAGGLTGEVRLEIGP